MGSAADKAALTGRVTPLACLRQISAYCCRGTAKTVSSKSPGLRGQVGRIASEKELKENMTMELFNRSQKARVGVCSTKRRATGSWSESSPSRWSTTTADGGIRRWSTRRR